MSTLDFSHLSPEQRLDLIGELWESLEAETVPLSSAQAAEIDRRLATLDDDLQLGEDAFAVHRDLTARSR